MLDAIWVFYFIYYVLLIYWVGDYSFKEFNVTTLIIFFINSIKKFVQNLYWNRLLKFFAIFRKNLAEEFDLPHLN